MKRYNLIQTITMLMAVAMLVAGCVKDYIADPQIELRVIQLDALVVIRNFR